MLVVFNEPGLQQRRKERGAAAAAAVGRKEGRCLCISGMTWGEECDVARNGGRRVLSIAGGEDVEVEIENARR